MDLTKIVFKDEFNNLLSHLKIVIKEKGILMILLISLPEVEIITRHTF